LNYTFDNTAPILTLSVTEEDALKVSNGKNIKIIVNELKEKNFKCKWALSNLTLTEDNLDAICTNGSNIDVPKNSEGYYKLWAFLEDEVGNKTLYSSYPFLVDSIGPSITVDILYEDEVYRNNNEIVISSTDNYSGISLIIYDWFPYNQTVIDGTRFRYSNLEEINYPDNIYGQYALWVYSKDGANNATLQKVANKFLIDTEKFTLSLKGKEIIKIVKKEKFVDPGVVALKGSREMNYEVVSNLNENKPGEYMITYKLDNLEISRKVIVQSTSKYYYIIGISVLAGITTSLIPFNKIRKKRD